MGPKSKEIYMNIFLIRNEESNKYIDKRGRQTIHTKCIKIHTDLGEARKHRAALSKQRPIKYKIEEYELTFLRET